MNAWPNSWIQSEVTQPPTTSRMLSGSVKPGAAPDHKPIPPTTMAPAGMANTGLTRTAPASEGSGRRRASFGAESGAVRYCRMA